MKKHILIFVDWYLPGYKAGGPIRSVSNMVQKLSDEFEFSIVTANTDFGETEGYKDIKADEWLETDGAKIIYLSSENRSKARMKEIIESTKADIVYFNSFFSSQFTLTPLRLIKRLRKDLKVVLAPRGMLAEGALQIKATKKRVFIAAAKAMGWYKNITWHASTKLEEQEIRNVFGSAANVVVAENVAVLEQSGNNAVRPPKTPGSARFYFISRIAIKKNLLHAIKTLGRIKAGSGVEFEIYGPIDELHYWEECQAEIKKLNGPKVTYKGVIPHEDVGEMEARQHFFLLPTLNENYGHVVVEAFTNGCPAVISDQTPWLRLEEKGVGWDIPLDDNAQWAAVLQSCVEMDDATYKQMSAKAASYGRQVIENPETIARNKELFRNL